MDAADDTTDIFPKYISKKFTKLHYPSSFVLLANDEKFKPFIAHIRNQLMYYKREESVDKYQRHLQDFDKAAKSIERFCPSEINWLRIYRRYKAKLNESFRSNVDVKAGFKIGDRYLVKHFFTFGQRTVRPHTLHVYQLLDVPLVLFVKKMNRGKIDVKDKLFPIHDYYKYEQLIMPPNGTYYIPEGTTYLVMALHKTFFSLNVFATDEFDIPSTFVNPIVAKVRKLKGMYDDPVETPFIDDLDREEEEVVERKQLAPKTDFLMQEFFIQPICPPPPVVYAAVEPRKIQFLQTPDFVKCHQSLMQKTYDDPRLFYCFENNQPTEEQTVPMDLSIDQGPCSEESLILQPKSPAEPSIEIQTSMPEIQPSSAETSIEIQPCTVLPEIEPPEIQPSSAEPSIETQPYTELPDETFDDLDFIIFGDTVKQDEVARLQEELIAASPFFQ